MLTDASEEEKKAVAARFHNECDLCLPRGFARDFKRHTKRLDFEAFWNLLLAWVPLFDIFARITRISIAFVERMHAKNKAHSRDGVISCSMMSALFVNAAAFERRAREVMCALARRNSEPGSVTTNSA